MTLKKSRRLKIHRKFRTRTWDNTTVPEIRLEGKWLEELGFVPGNKVIIDIERNTLIITIDKDDVV